MIDPIRDQQVREMEMVERCVNILTMSRNELYIHMRYLDISLSCLGFEADWNRNGAATDGFMIYYEPDYLIKLFAQGRKEVNRAYLHMVMHCLFGHMDGRKGRDAGLWHLACDMAVESIIDGLLKTCIRRPPSMVSAAFASGSEGDECGTGLFKACGNETERKAVGTS